MARPNDSFDQEDTVWYCNSPLGKNSLANFMSDISKAAKLSMVYTNHSVRATSITIMDNGGITGRHIMKVSGHRSETSLKSYSNRVSDKKKKEISDVLSNAISVNTISTDSASKNTTVKANLSMEDVSKDDNQPFLPSEVLDIFANDITLEEVDENDPLDLLYSLRFVLFISR